MLAQPLPGWENAANGQAIAHGSDAGLIVNFYRKGVHLVEESKRQGRPIFTDKVFCRILTPGDADNVWDQPVRDSDKMRFRPQWESFERGEEQAQTGTPLETWTRMTASKVLAYKSVHISTVEQVANIADANGRNMPMDWMDDRIAARAYLQAAEDSAIVQRQAQQLAERDAEIALLKGNIADLGGKLDQLLARIPPEQLQPAAKAKGK